MVTNIVIPVRDQLQYTKAITEQLKYMDGWDHCWILDNGSTFETVDYLTNLCFNFPRFTQLPARDKTIYEMWDWGFTCSRFSDHVLFLNNDVVLHENTITDLNQALESNDDFWLAYPDYTWVGEAMRHRCNYKVTSGTFRHGGMSGFCFMLKTKKVGWKPLVDPRFVWWGGDDDIAFEVEARGGKQIRVVGLPIEHVNEGTARHHELGAQKAADLNAVIEKWGR